MNYEISEPNDPTFYGDNIVLFRFLAKDICNTLDCYRTQCKNDDKRDKIEHVKIRIKGVQSLKEKLLLRGMEPTLKNALENITDIVGIRIVTSFIDDVYKVADYFGTLLSYEVTIKKDYIATPKPNGYRSLHLILKKEISIENITCPLNMEVQIRTVMMDAWASLEHQLKYKKEISEKSIIAKELKRLSGEMASTDLCLESIKEMLPQKWF